MIQDAGFLKTLNSTTQPRRCAVGISRLFRIAVLMLGAGGLCWVTVGRAEPGADTGTQDDTTQMADREGPRVKVKQIKFIGNKAFESSTLEKLLKTKKKKWFAFPSNYSEQTVRDDAEKLREFYYNRGYLGYNVEIETQFTSDRSQVLVTFHIDEGPPYYIKAIAFGGNEFFQEEELWAQLEIAEGQIYCREKADRDTKRIEEQYREKGFIDAHVGQSLRLAPGANDNSVVVDFTTYEGRQFRIGRIEITGNERVQDKVARRVLDEYDFVPGQLYNAEIAPKQGNGLMEMYVQRSSGAEEVTIRPVDPEDGSPDRKDYVSMLPRAWPECSCRVWASAATVA
jgi:outer membrane protein assembly factor BamA